MSVAGISRARKAAFAVLMAVERGQSHSDDLLRGKAINALSFPDRHLSTALVLGVLRWQLVLDAQIRALLAKPNARLDREVMIALRLGAFQILFLDRIPARAAIDESVELAKQAGHRFASGMVNAVLRKLGAQPALDLNALLAGVANAPTTPMPTWMVDRWTEFYGVAATQAICVHAQSQPVASIRMESPEVEAELSASGVVLAPGELLSAARTVVAGDVTATAAVKEGRVCLQDEGSQLVAEIAAAAAHNAQYILDACAAPGGKTLILAGRNPLARIVACESSAPRHEQLGKRLEALTPRVECRLADATALSEEAVFDLALADVPCSGTGTLGRNPEIRYRLGAEDLSRQAARQRAILAAALRAVRPGGSVVYSTCSLEPEENEHVLSAVLAENADTRMGQLCERLEGMLREGTLTVEGAQKLRSCITPEGALRLLPGAFHTDGFFIALLERAG